jgi:hypothetical protein
MTFSPFDKRLLEEGLGWFARPRLAGLLETLGTDEWERVETLVTMLRHAPQDEYDEAIDLFERAGARAARDRGRDEGCDGVEEPRRKRYSASAERREQRRRSG